MKASLLATLVIDSDSFRDTTQYIEYRGPTRSPSTELVPGIVLDHAAEAKPHHTLCPC
jgi:hypothetical protein